MKKTNREAAIVDFCTDGLPEGRVAVQAMALRWNEEFGARECLAIAEFRRDDHGAGLADSVLEWASAAPGDTLTLEAITYRGRGHDGEHWEAEGFPVLLEGQSLDNASP